MISSKEGQTFFSIRMKNRKKAASMKLPTAIRIQGVFFGPDALFVKNSPHPTGDQQQPRYGKPNI